MRNYLIIALAMLAVTTDPAIAAEQKLSGNAVKTVLTGARVYWRGGAVQSDYKAGGVLRSAHSSGRSDSGKWWVEGDNYCRQYQRWGHGKKRCWSVFLNGQKIRFKAIDNGQSETGRLVR